MLNNEDESILSQASNINNGANDNYDFLNSRSFQEKDNGLDNKNSVQQSRIFNTDSGKKCHD